MQLAAKALICKVPSGIIISEHDTERTDDMNIISADKLTKQYGDFKAVNGISFTVEKGELLGFLGVNGAGVLFLALGALATKYARRTDR